MAKRKKANPFLGRWLIEHMDQWDVEEESEELQPFLEFESDSGQFQFGCVYGEMDVRLGQREGQPAVEFFLGRPRRGRAIVRRGWAIVDGDKLSGMIFIHHGDESAFEAKRVTAKPVRKKK